VLGLDVASGEDGAAGWRSCAAFLARGLAGVGLVTSDAHTGLKQAVGATLPGASWQRSSVQTPRRREGPARHLHRRERTLAA
jgi:transposase-like protein